MSLQVETAQVETAKGYIGHRRGTDAGKLPPIEGGDIIIAKEPEKTEKVKPAIEIKAEPAPIQVVDNIPKGGRYLRLTNKEGASYADLKRNEAMARNKIDPVLQSHLMQEFIKFM